MVGHKGGEDWEEGQRWGSRSGIPMCRVCRWRERGGNVAHRQRSDIAGSWRWAPWPQCGNNGHQNYRKESAEAAIEGFYSIMQTGREKKSIHNGWIYYLPHLTCNVPKMMELHFLHSLYRSYFLSVPSSALSTCFWLVVAYKIVYHQPTKASMYVMHFIFLSFDSMVQMIGLRPPTRSPPWAPLL